MKIAVGSDHAGYLLKTKVLQYLTDIGVEFTDMGCYSEESVDYPDYALKVAKSVASGEYDKGIFVCGTGIGISIAANKVKGIRCALCYNANTAELTRKHNDANIVAFGGRVIEEETMKQIVHAFLNTDFEGGRHQRRVDKIARIENEYFK